MKQIYYNSTTQTQRSTEADPFARPQFSWSNKLRRAAWQLCWAVLAYPTPRNAHQWRAFLLRRFGAQLGPACHIYPKARIWAPWNLICADAVAIGDDAEIYNQAPIELSSHAIVSQGALLCASTHDYNDPAFPLLAYRMNIGAYAWICARAIVGPRVHVGEGAVLGIGSVATRDLDPWSVYAGNPAVKIKERNREGFAVPGIVESQRD